MGSLTVPTTGLIYVDAQIIIYSVERREPYAALLQPFWDAVQTGSATAITSKLSILETLVLPLRDHNAALLAGYEGFFASPILKKVDTTEMILREAARHRAQHRHLKSPDAIHMATALHSNVQTILTNDRDLARAGLSYVLVLDDVVSAGTSDNIL